jgi:hypothetical protein
MTEKEWLESTSVSRMLMFLDGRLSARQARLFAVACSRRAWYRMHDSRSQTAVDVAERFANGQASRKELLEVARAAAEAAGEVEE